MKATLGRPRHGLTVIETLLAAGVLLLVLGLLWAALDLVLRGTGKAEWLGAAERRFESFSHVLGEELRRANHLITAEPGGRRVHDPRFSAVWIGEGGQTLAFRIFRSDQEVADPADLDVEQLVQERVFFLFREGRVVYRRTGGQEPEETRVLLEDVAELHFTAQGSYQTQGPLGGLLAVRVRLRRPGTETGLVRELSCRASVPVLVEGAAPAEDDFLPPPSLDPSPRAQSSL